MGLRTALRIFGALSAFWFLSSFAQGTGGAASAGAPQFVADCRPCSFALAAGGPVYSFRFEVGKTPQGRVIEGIDVAGGGGAAQRLAVADMTALRGNQQFFFGGVDINFDGTADLMLMTRQGVANAYAMYWVFDKESKSFRPLGTFPVFQVDAVAHRLKTYERGGSGGMIHEAKEYGFERGRLVVLRDEKQDATGKAGVFKQTVTERKGGVMEVVSVKMVRGARGG